MTANYPFYYGKMRYLLLLFISLFCFSTTATAQWKKINEIDYVWGPFTIYHFSLFSETGEYWEGTRPVMLSLNYKKPVDGRDFAISLARSWSNLGITLANQDDVVDRLRKIMPNIKKGDVLSYIALEDKGYFILNDRIIDEEFNQEFNNAVVAVWLDPRVEIGRALLSKQQKMREMPKSSVVLSQEKQPQDLPEQAVSSAQHSANDETKIVLSEAEKPENQENKTKTATADQENNTSNQGKTQENTQESELEKKAEPINSDPAEIERSESKTIAPIQKEPENVPNKAREDESLEVLPLNDPVLLKEQPLG